MSKPDISVVIPTQNRAQYLIQALDSVFAQTLPAAEIIVVDDGSTDNTRNLLDPLIREEKIRYFFQQPKGVSAARNKGVGMAKSRFIAFLDSDDIFLPQKLEKQMALFLKHPELGFVHCCFSKFNDEGEDLGVRDTSRFSGVIYPDMLLEWSVLMAMPCMLVRADVINEVGGFDEQIIWAEDMDLWRRIAKRYPIDLVAETLVKVRVHPSGASMQKSKAFNHFQRYLDKAFADDPSLGRLFRRRVYGKMNTHFGKTMLGEGNAKEMELVRKLCFTSLRWWPFDLYPLLVWLVTLIPKPIRIRLAHRIRKSRYPK